MMLALQRLESRLAVFSNETKTPLDNIEQYLETAEEKLQIDVKTHPSRATDRIQAAKERLKTVMDKLEKDYHVIRIKKLIAKAEPDPKAEKEYTKLIDLIGIEESWKKDYTDGTEINAIKLNEEQWLKHIYRVFFTSYDSLGQGSEIQDVHKDSRSMSLQVREEGTDAFYISISIEEAEDGDVYFSGVIREDGVSDGNTYDNSKDMLIELCKLTHKYTLADKLQATE